MAVLKRTLFIITRELMLKKQEKWYNNIIITTETKGITKRKINTIRASAQSGPHSFASITLPAATDSV
jgi:hypothetical protein